jgi:phage terminase small subunit
MTITLEPDLEQKIEAAAKRAGQDVNRFVSNLLMCQLAEQERVALDKEVRKARLRLQAQQMAADPLFLQDIEETMEAYKYIDSETARMMDEEEGCD